MEVTTVSPSPASPTEGDNICEIDFTDVAMHSVALLICLCGLAGNGAVLWLLSLKTCNSAIFQLAFTDFLLLLFTMPSILLFLVEDVSCSPIMPLTYVSFLFQLSVVTCYWGLYWLSYSSNMINMYKLFKLYLGCDLPVRLTWIEVSVRIWAFFALFSVIPTVTSWCPSHEQEQCRTALFSIHAVILFLFAAPMVISSTIHIIKAEKGSWQQQSKRRSVVIFIILLFTLLLIICNFLQQLGYILVPFQAFFLLTCIHSSIKPFIYFVAGRCWSPGPVGSLWLSLQRVFDEKEEKTAHRNDAPRDTGV